MNRRSTQLLFALAITLGVSVPAQAIDIPVGNEKLRLDITQSTYWSYHGDFGYLISQTDRQGKPLDVSFYDFINRINVDLSWRKFRLATRFDSAVYFDTPQGSCGPSASTPSLIRSRFCQNYLYPEKLALEYTDRVMEATLGDFYVSFGRGLVLSIRKLDELGIDTTLRGAKWIYHQDNVAATLVVGLPARVFGGTNIQNVDEATGRYASDPFDFIAGGRVEYRIAHRVTVGFHEAGGIQNNNQTSSQTNKDNYFMYGGTIDAPRLTSWLGLYLEGAGQSVEQIDRRQTGYALYGAATGYFGPAALLIEGKHYDNYQRWKSSVDGSLAEFAPVAYNQPPTAERLVTEIVSPIYDVSGARARLDYRLKKWALIYLSYAYFYDRGTSFDEKNPLQYHDPYVGAEFRWNDGSSHFFPSGGYRIERCGFHTESCEQTSPAGGEFQHVGHVEWDAAQKLPHGVSVEAQGFALFRRGDNVTNTLANGLVGYPSWTEGDAYFAVKWTPYLVGSVGYEWSTRPSPKINQNYVNGALQWNITTASSIRVFVGGTRGGLKCISGICRDFPAFTGGKLEIVFRL